MMWRNWCNKKEIRNGDIIIGLIISICAGICWGYLIFT